MSGKAVFASNEGGLELQAPFGPAKLEQLDAPLACMKSEHSQWEYLKHSKKINIAHMGHAYWHLHELQKSLEGYQKECEHPHFHRQYGKTYVTGSFRLAPLLALGCHLLAADGKNSGNPMAPSFVMLKPTFHGVPWLPKTSRRQVFGTRVWTSVLVRQHHLGTPGKSKTPGVNLHLIKISEQFLLDC